MRSTLTRLAALPKITPILAVATLVALVVTTLGYFQLSHSVTLSLDGKVTQVRTFGGTVGDVLRAEGVKTSSRDVVVPGPQSELIDGAEISVRFARPLAVNLDGRTGTYWTTARTVSAALGDLDLRADGAKLSVSRSASIDRDGMALTIATPKSLTVKIGKQKAVHREIPALTAKDALTQLGVGHDVDDIVRPAGRVLKDGDKLVLVRVRQETKSVRGERVPFATTRKADDSLYKGESKVDRSGTPGTRDVTYKIVWHNGAVHRKTVLNQRLTRAAVPAIVRYGTKQEPAPDFAGGNGPFDRIAQCESGGNWSINTGNGYYGGLQFSASTWHAYGGTGLPHEHSREEQIAVAKRLVAAQGGYGAWPHCGRFA